MKFPNKLLRYAIFSSTAVVAMGQGISPSYAQTQSTRQGTIRGIFVSASDNYGFRVYLSNSGTDTLADCTADFAFVNGSQSNYESYVAALLSNYHTGRPVTLTVGKNGNGFCQIFDMEG